MMPKCRAWIKEKKCMAEVALLHWSEDVPTSTELVLMRVAVRRQDNGGWIYEHYKPYQVELMWSIEPLSRDGKQIYEGDIVAVGLGSDFTRSVVRIGLTTTEGSDNCYPEDYYGVYLDGSTGLVDALLRGAMYVLGNEREHPELLESK